jgi:very-short-patch-repair endonuclease
MVLSIDKNRNRYIPSDKLKFRRRVLRNKITDAELSIWNWIRRKAMGFKFRRQAGIGCYIVDFYCHELKLIIEIDGGIHDEQEQYDQRRENWLKRNGYHILRFKNENVMYDLDSALTKIKTFISSLTNPQ